jgi:hypothetical protein
MVKFKRENKELKHQLEFLRKSSETVKVALPLINLGKIHQIKFVSTKYHL